MKNIYTGLLKEGDIKKKLALATILETRGSAPQVQGASAVFSASGLVSGTLGGGVLEGDATEKSHTAISNRQSILYEYELDADISSEEGAICGGKALILIDSLPETHQHVFSEMGQSISSRHPGVLACILVRNKDLSIERYWLEEGETGESKREELTQYSHEIGLCLEDNKCRYIQISDRLDLFLEPVFPLPGLLIAGAGHIGRALAHMANLLDFKVSIVDDRPEYANPQNIPDADHCIVDNIGKAIGDSPISHDTYVVIVTRGHRDDAEALKACLNSGAAYIGMIGSRRKIRLMRDHFISNKWSTPAQFDRVYAPIGIDIKSKTIQEIAVSISAQLIQVRQQQQAPHLRPVVGAVILAAGESKRMGEPKMLLPYGDSSMIETLIRTVEASRTDHIVVVLGANSEQIRQKISNFKVLISENQDFASGMLSSVQSGLRALPADTDAVMVLLGDQPMIGRDIMDTMIDSFRKSKKGILVACHGEKRGHPILFDIQYKEEVEQLTAAGSLRDLLQNHPADIREVQIGTADILRDIDTIEDYNKELKIRTDHD